MCTNFRQTIPVKQITFFPVVLTSLSCATLILAVHVVPGLVLHVEMYRTQLVPCMEAATVHACLTLN